MAGVDRRLFVAVLAGLVLVGAGIAITEFRDGTADDRTRVTVVDENGVELATVEVRVAESFNERYTGLSDTESLGANEGMLFVHDTEGRYTYVMRDMAFPIDIVFIDADQRITVIYYAEIEDRPLTEYTGRGKWVLEVPYRWTERHGIEPGHRVIIERS